MWCLAASLFLCACATSPAGNATNSTKITRAEAKRLACPSQIIASGATTEDCNCVENHLFEIGQNPGALKGNKVASTIGVGGEQGKRDIAIGILRLDAFEQCGFFDPAHPVSRNLQAPAS
jgi:hypothetical protein